jgi:hypothetical protein
MFAFQLNAFKKKDEMENINKNINMAVLEDSFTTMFNFRTAYSSGGENRQLFDASKFNGTISIGIGFSPSGEPLKVVHLSGNYDGKPVEGIIKQKFQGSGAAGEVVATSFDGKFSLPSSESFLQNEGSVYSGADAALAKIKQSAQKIATEEFSKAKENVLISVEFKNGISQDNAARYHLNTDFKILLASSNKDAAKRALAYFNYNVENIAYAAEKTKKLADIMNVFKNNEGAYLLQTQEKDQPGGYTLVGIIRSAKSYKEAEKKGELLKGEHVGFSITKNGKRQDYVFEPINKEMQKEALIEGPMK